MAVKQALILAAGRGVRMGRRGQTIPKGLIEVGGEQLIVRSLSLLAHAGIQRVTIVTGHLADQYEKLSSAPGVLITKVHNAQYAERGSFESLRVGLSTLQGPFLLLESDIIYETRALSAVMSSDSDSVILTSGPTGAGDEVYVWADERDGVAQFRGMSKQRQRYLDEPFGELVGISKISAELAGHLWDQSHEIEAQSDYESAIVRAADSSPIACLKVADLLWGEVDDEDMLMRVRDGLWPRLRDLRRGPVS